MDGESRVNVADKPSVHRLNRESHSTWLSHRIAKLVKPRFVPGHIVTEYFQQALNISGVCHYHFERKLMRQPFQLGIV